MISSRRRPGRLFAAPFVLALLAAAPLALALLAAVSAPGLAAAPGIDLSAQVAPDPETRTGVLANGLTYFIRANVKPENRVELRLAVRIGSVAEKEEERGLAHFVEHMNFNGTENFKAGELVAYLESIGARFGADSNAYTSYDETVYFLQVPTDKPGALEKGLMILADWTGRATLEGIEIDKERGVVLDELRGRKGAWMRIRERQDQLTFQGSRYADRLPIGTEAVITGASHATIRDFYHRWYRPENVAVAIVGAVDPEAMEARVKEVFGSLAGRGEATAVPRFDVPAHARTLVGIDSDAELTSSSMSLLYKHPWRTWSTVGELRGLIVEQVAAGLLTQRLVELAQSTDPPFLGAWAGVGSPNRGMRSFSINSRVKDGEVPRAAEAINREIERARRHGFLDSELARVKESVLAAADSQLREAPQRRSNQLAGALVRSFLDGAPVLSAEEDHRLTHGLVPKIGLGEVVAAFNRLTDTKSRVVLASVPEKPGLTVPAEPEFLAALAAGVEAAGEAWVDDTGGESLMPEPPAPGRVVARRAIPEIGVEEWHLSNGALVVVKATDFRNDQVLMSGFARGGSAAFEGAAHLAAHRADALAVESGVAEHSAPQLRKLLAGKLAWAQPGVNLFSRSLSGSATPSDMETMLQLAHLFFTRPAFRPDALARIVDREVESLRNAWNSPGGTYSRVFSETAHGGHPLFSPESPESIQALTLEAVAAAYRAMFADASEWTFILVGNVDLATHLPLVERYLASLPAPAERQRLGRNRNRETLVPTPIRFPSNPATRMVAKGIEDQSRTALMFEAGHDLDGDEAFLILAMNDLLSIRLRERLREERGETYGVGVSLSTLSPYRDYGRITISFSSSPEARNLLVSDIAEEVARLRTTLPSAEDVAKLKELRYKALTDAQKENGYWRGQLHSAYLNRHDPRDMLKSRARIDRLEARDIRAIARRYLRERAPVEVFLVPEGWGPSRWLLLPDPAAMAGGA